MSTENARSLSELVGQWRETADIWERQLQHAGRSTRGTVAPPERGTAGIRNWINWLRACANDVERLSSGKAE